MIHGTLQIENHPMRVCEWVEELGRCLECVRESMKDNMVDAKEKLKQDFDTKARDRRLREGDMVLMRLPGLTWK